MILPPHIIQFPFKGLVDAVGYEKYPEDASPSINDFMPYDNARSASHTSGGRKRGGLRPGTKMVSYISALIADSFDTLYQGTSVAGNPVLVGITRSGKVYYGTDPAANMTYTGSGSVWTNASITDIFGVAYIVSPNQTTVLALDLTSFASSTLATGVLGFPPPSRGTACCNFRSRLCIAVGKNLYMSRAGDPTDWDISQTDSQASVDLNASIGAGKVGSAIIGLVPVGRNSLFIGCYNSCFVIEGDPGDGGNVVTISSAVGIRHRQAWCLDGMAKLYFVGTNGFYGLTHGGELEDISGSLCPNFFRNATDLITSTSHVGAAYDTQRRGVWFFGPTTTGFFFDTRTGGFFPHTILSTYCGVSWTPSPATTASKAAIYCGVDNGAVTKIDETYYSDDQANTFTGLASSGAIQPVVEFGPLRPEISVPGGAVPNPGASILSGADIYLGEDEGLAFSCTMTFKSASTGFVSTGGVGGISASNPRQFTVVYTTAGLKKLIRRLVGGEFIIRVTGITNTPGNIVFEKMVLRFGTSGAQRDW